MDNPPRPGFNPGGMWSTRSVGPDEAFDYWHDLICDAFVQLSASPKPGGPFTGDIEHHELEDVGLSVVRADGQRVDRTKDLIARSQEDYLLASNRAPNPVVVDGAFPTTPAFVDAEELAPAE